MDKKDTQNSSAFFSRLKYEVDNYVSQKIEVSEGVFFSQYQTIKRIMKFKNRDLTGSKITEDLRYDYYFDIISPRTDSEVRNLRFDTKNILVFSLNPVKDFPVVFVTNAKLKEWMLSNGEDDKLKAVVEEFSGNGNIIFKKIEGGYETTDPLNTYVTNQKAKMIDDTDLVERHEMTASQLKLMSAWDNVDEFIKNCPNKTFSATTMTTSIQTSTKRYEVLEYTGEVSEKEFNELAGIPVEGDEHKFFLAKTIVGGLTKNNVGEKYVLFCEKLTGKMSDWYIDAHRGRYEGRFWRIGIYELLFDYQIRANEIANNIATGLEWASKVIFKSSNSQIMQNIRADMDNGDVIITNDLNQLDVRLHNLDQLIADWNRNLTEADRVSNSTQIVRGEGGPTGMPYRSLAAMNDNAVETYMSLRQKLTMPFRRVFRDWLMPELVKSLKGEEIFRITGDDSLIEQFQKIVVNSWYLQNLIHIGPHTQQIADQIKDEKLAELKETDPVIKNESQVWKGVLPRLFITITGDSSDVSESVQTLVNLLQFEHDPDRINWILDRIYALEGLPVPPKSVTPPPMPPDPNEPVDSNNPNSLPQQPKPMINNRGKGQPPQVGKGVLPQPSAAQ